MFPAALCLPFSVLHKVVERWRTLGMELAQCPSTQISPLSPQGMQGLLLLFPKICLQQLYILVGLYKYHFKIRLAADKTCDCSLWWLGRALQRLLQSQLCLAQEVVWFSSSKLRRQDLATHALAMCCCSCLP